MGKYKILDCTLRDGGYINEWNFSEKISNAIHNSLVEAKIEILECGYLTDKKSKPNSTLFQSIKEFEAYIPVIKSENYERVLMINHGDYDVNQLPLNDTNSLDGIRLAFHKKNLLDAAKDAKIIINKGYKLFFQPMVVKSYNPEEYINLIKIANTLQPFAFYIVDSFGSLDKKEFLRYFSMTDNILEQGISIGFHGHNNMQFVYANAIILIENAMNRDVIIDSSIFGMGRGAGNLNSEIITNYLNKYYQKDYIIEPMLEVMDDYLEELYRKNPWGFTASQFLSAKHECHPNYASHLTAKKKLTVTDINEILSQVDEEKKKSFSADYLDNLYKRHNEKKHSTKVFDTNILLGHPLVLIGSGKSIESNVKTIQQVQSQNSTITILLNRYDETFDYDYIFFSNQKRYNEYSKQIKNKHSLITTSNIDTQGEQVAQIDYTALLEASLDSYDNILILLFSLLSTIEYNKTIYIAGIDGYDIEKENYINESIILLDKKQMAQENNNLSNAINYYTPKLDIHFITPSIFHSQKQLKAIGVIPARYKSSRFEGKPLCIIDGIPMIKRTYEQAKKSLLLDKVVVATEDSRIEEYCIKENIPVIMTSDKCLTGTDRIAEVSQKEHFDLYINIQGDEPVIDSISIDEIAKEYQKYGETYIAYNLYKTEEDYTEVNSDTIIKTIVNENDELMYMSRLPIPFNKSKTQPTYKKQVCVYGFTKKALDIFSSREKTLNEVHEDIEILRFVDMGYKVKMKETTVDSIAVDIPSDIIKVEKFLKEKKSTND